MVFHIHYTNVESSGEIRRIRNIHNNFVAKDGDHVIEICCTSVIGAINKSNFRLSDSVIKKIYLPRLPFSKSCIPIKWINSIWLSFLIWIFAKLYKPSKIFTEYSTSGETTLLISDKIKKIVDVHGALLEEYIYATQRTSNHEIKWIEVLEKATMRRADKIICQSKEMKNYLIKKYQNIVQPNDIFIFRCSADENQFKYDEESRNGIRKQLNLDSDNILLVYSGGMMKWQMIDETINSFVNLHKINTNVKLLILTGTPNIAKEKIEAHKDVNTSCVTIKSVPFNEVSKYLSACDAGYLIRENTTMNAVAFPTKLAEYMMCGLPVISSEVANKWVDFTDYIINVNSPAKDILDEITNANKNDIIKFAKDALSLKQDNEEVERFSKE